MTKPKIKTAKNLSKTLNSSEKAVPANAASDRKKTKAIVPKKEYSIEELAALFGQRESFWKNLISAGKITIQQGKDGLPKVSQKTLRELIAGYAILPTKQELSSSDKSAPVKSHSPHEAASTQKPSAAGRRPFHGFDIERAAYARLKPKLLEECEGKYVVFVGEEMLGPFDNTQDTMRAAYRRFGLGPIYIKQVLPVDPITVIAALFDGPPCQS